MKEDQERKPERYEYTKLFIKGTLKYIGLAGGKHRNKRAMIYLDVGGACTYRKSMWSINAF